MHPRIYADFNGLGALHRFRGRLAVPLDTLGSLWDLSNAGVRLHDGQRLRIYDGSDEEEDLEADATVYFSHEECVWMAELDESGCRYVPKRDLTPDLRRLCLGCRRDLAGMGVMNSARPEASELCPLCATPGNAALAPPPV